MAYPYADPEQGDVVTHKNTGGNIYTVEKVENGRVFLINNTGHWPLNEFSVVKKAEKKGTPMLNDMKDYFGKNKDTFFTLGAVLILDYFLFGGAMRKKVQDVVEKMLNNVTKKVDDQ